jgi:hypothetical protein
MADLPLAGSLPRRQEQIADKTPEPRKKSSSGRSWLPSHEQSVDSVLTGGHAFVHVAMGVESHAGKRGRHRST